ncbi:MAG: sigma-70 family RNA polymerase sigma factor [Bacteroidetes bacterium]|nr:sigma-70 family RNA polymerase sigma factor [Bacteroidota bacterium]
MRRIRISQRVTTRDSNSLNRYLKEIGDIEVLSCEEEIALLKRIRVGDTNALEHFTRANLRFVVAVAKQYQNNGMSLPDLICEGNLGLLKATERFDETRGFKFISYAIWWVQQCIMKALSEHSRIIRLPQNQLGSLNKIKNAFAMLEQEFEREPSCEELSRILEVDTNEIHLLIELDKNQVSVDAPISLDADGSWLDVLENKDAEPTDYEIVHNESLREELHSSLSLLTEKQAQVIKLYFGIGEQEPLNLQEIGQRMKVSNERVRQLKTAALKRLRQTTRSKILKDYFGKP